MFSKIFKIIPTYRKWILIALIWVSGNQGFSQTTLFSENFESYATTTSLNTTGTNQWLQRSITATATTWAMGGTNTYCINGNRSLTLYNGSYYTYRNNDNGNKIAYYSERIDARLYGQLKLDFKWISNGETGYDFGTVVWSTDGTTWNDVSITEYQGVTTTQNTTNLDLSAADGTQFYIGFRWENDGAAGTNPPFTIDDILITGTVIVTAGSENFDGGTGGWSFSGDFQVGTASDATARSGTSVLATILTGNYNNNNTEATDYAISPTYNCSSLSSAKLTYWSYSRFRNDADRGYLYISNNNGGTWTLIETLNTGGTGYDETGTGWTKHTIDISSYADGQSQIKVRYTIFSNTANARTGWNIDDLSISGIQSVIDYFSVGSTNANLLTSWQNASGVNPTNFASNNQRFIIRNGHTMTTSANWAISGTGTSLYIQNGSLTANNEITLSANTTFQIDNGSSYNHNVNSDAVWNGTENFGTSSTINYGYGGNQNLIGGVNYGNLTISNSGTKTMNGDILVNGNLSITGSSSLSAEQYQITGNATGTLTMAAGTSLFLGSTSSSNNVLFPTNFTSANISLNNTSTVIYQANGAQSISSGPSAYGNLTISGGNTKNLQGAITVNGTLNLNNGNISLGTNNLTIGMSGNITGTFNATHMIVCNGGTNTGSLIRLGDAASDFIMTYPVGAGVLYTPMTISAFSATITTPASISINSIPTYYSAGGAIASDLNRYWTINTTNLADIVSNASFSYVAGDVPGTGTESSYATSFYSSGNWNFFGSVNSATHVAPASSISNFAGIWTARKPAGTYYSYQSGPWTSTNTWTTDASGTLWVNAAVPGAGDNVIILNGRTVTAQDAGRTIGSLEIREGGILDIGTITTHSFGEVRGQGKLKLNSSTFPTGTFDEFVAAGGGTVEYYNIGTTAAPAAISTVQLTYNNLIISNSTATARSVYLNNSSNGITYVLNGSFTLLNTSSSTLTFKIGNSTVSDNLINMTVYGNFSVGTGCVVGVNNFATNGHSFVGSAAMPAYPVHTINIYGDLTNNGQIRFTGLPSTTNNATLVAYYSLANNQYSGTNYGAAQVYFKGTTNNTVTCNGVTDFFRLIVEKGTDQTYILDVHSSDPNYFALYGPNYQGGGTKTGGLPEDLGWGIYYKALFIHYGILKLNDNISIPSLTEGGLDFNICSTAQIWVNGANISTTISGQNATGYGNGAYQALTLVGGLRISAGQLSTGDATGIVLHKNGTPLFQIEETGILDISEFWVDKTGTNLISYIQTGGTVNVRMRGQQQSGPMMDLGNITTVFKMSGGTINFTDNVFNGGTTLFNVLDIEAAPGNFEVTGGTVNFNLPSSATVYTANSTVPLYNLNISRNGSTTTGTTTIQWNTTGRSTGTNTNLTILNDLTIGANTLLNLGTNTINLYEGGDLNINGTYTTGTNSTIFNGTGNQTLDLQGTCTFNHLELAGTSRLTLNNANVATAIVANGNFTLGNGSTLIDNGRILQLTGTTGTLITNNGIHFKPASGAGSIRLTGTTAQTITGDGNGKFNNLTLYKTGGTVTLASDMDITGELRLAGTTNGAWNILNIGTKNLYLDSAAVVYSDLNNPTAVFNNTRMIQTSGLMSDGGVSKKFSSTTAFTFPFGISGYYLPASIQFASAPSTYGVVTTRPVNAIHPLAQNANVLGCYWKTESEGFSGIPANSVRHNYFYNDAFLNGAETSYIPGFYNHTLFNWNYINNTSLVDEGTNMITYGTASAADGDFTAGFLAAFGAITVLYSVNDGPWTTASTWNTHEDGSGVSGVPNNSTMVLIVNNHTVHVTAANANAGGLYIENGSTLDLRTFQGHNFEAIPNNKVSGSGTLRIGSTNYFPQGDFGNFIGPNGGTVEYYTSAAVTAITIPTQSTTTALPLSTYNHLIVNTTSGATHSVILPARNLTVYGNMTVMGNGNTAGSGTGTPATTGREYSIEGNLDIVSGLLEYRNNVAHTITVKGNTNIDTDGTFRANATASATNILNLYGNLTNEGSFDMNNTGRALTYFKGLSNDSIKGSGATYDFYNLTVDKGSDASSVLYLQSDITTGFTNPFLTLLNGTFRVDGPDVTVSTTTAFFIPQTACFSVKSGSATIGTNSNTGDVSLSGKLEIMGGTLNVGNTTGYNNDIEYAAAGTPTLEITGGILNVRGQIRRSVDNTSGSLIYRQITGDVFIYGDALQPSRAKLEITNLNSRFEMSGGTITLLSASGTTYYDLYLRPENYLVNGGTIYLGNGSSAGTQDFGIVASAPLWNLVVGTASVNQTATLNILPLSILNQLTINGNSVFDANGFGVNIMGSMNNNNSDNSTGIANGGFRPGSLVQTTTFSGTSSQAITGNGSNLTNFANLVINKTIQSVTLGTNSDIRINGNLTITSGTLADGQNIIQLAGNVSNSGSHSSTGIIGGIYFVGTLNQEISGNGNGEYGNITLNNPIGVDMVDNARINGQLTFTSGSLYIDDYLLTLGPDATIGGTPSASRMISTNGVLSDKGLRKMFNTGNTAAFTYPIGISGKYTPVMIDFSANSSNNSEITIIPINELHRSVTGAPADYLKYFWNVIPSNLGTYTVNYQFTYSDEDIVGNENNYIAQRYDIPTNIWYNNLPPGTLTTGNNTFSYTGVSANLTGEYTAGQAFTPQGMLYSINNGNWGTAGTWSYTAGGASCGCTPAGHPVTISAGTTVTMASNTATAYSVTINGTLNAGTTTFHNLGHVNGPGTLVLTATTDGMFVFPGGEYDGFMANSLSTVEFTGSSDGTLPLKPGNEYKPYQNVILSGTGIKYMSAENLKIMGDLTIRSVTYLNNTLYNKNLTLLGDWTDEHTAASGFLPGTGIVTMNGTGPQSMYLGFTENFYDLAISNPVGVNVAAGNAGLAIARYLVLTSGNFHTETGKIITINNTSTTAVIGGGPSSFIDGPLRKKIVSGQSFVFPVGHGTRFGQVVLLNTNTATSPADWTATYTNANPNTDGYLTGTSHYNSPISGISNNEYWSINRPSGGSANIRIRWDANSYPAFTGSSTLRSRLRVAEYASGTALWTERGSLISGNATDGTISTTIPVTQDNYIFSIGIIGVTAGIQTPPATYSICNNGEIIYVPVTLSGTSPWTLDYRTTGTTTTNFHRTAITSSTFLIPIRGSDIGGYSATPYTLSLVSVSDASSSGTVTATTVSVTVKQTYIPSIVGPASVGSGETRSYTTANHTGSTYVWSWVGPSGGTITPSGQTASIHFSAVLDTFQLQVVETSASACTASHLINIIISATPTPSITPTTENICIGSNIVYSTQYNTGNAYNWTVVNGTCTGCGVWGTGSAAASITVRWNSTGPGSVSVTERTATLITGSTTNAYSISAMPINKTLVENAICSGNIGSISVVSSEANISYQLYLNDDNSAVGTPVSGVAATNISLPTGMLTASEEYYVMAYNEGCSLRIPAAGYVTESIYPIPEPTITGPDTLCTGSAAIYHTEAGMSNYIWTISPSGSGSISAPVNSASVTISWGSITGMFENRTLTVEYTSEHGCETVTPAEMDIRIFKVPETGPSYHIPN